MGDEITLDTPKGPQKFRVAATASAYLVGGMLAYMEGQTARRLLGVNNVNTYIVNALPGQRTQVEERLKPLCEKSGLLLHSFVDLRHRLDGMINSVVAGLWVLLALTFIIGAFGVANTLTMNVLEQTRELALLRVVAMTRRQVRKTILGQAVLIGFIGLTLGISRGDRRLLHLQSLRGAGAGSRAGVLFAPLAAGCLFRDGTSGDRRRRLVARRACRPAEAAHRATVRVSGGPTMIWEYCGAAVSAALCRRPHPRHQHDEPCLGERPPVGRMEPTGLRRGRGAGHRRADQQRGDHRGGYDGHGDRGGPRPARAAGRHQRH